MNMQPGDTQSAVPTASMASVNGMSAMSGMPSTFSTSTHVTLWFTNWTTASTTSYILTILFLFSLGIFNRFLGALRSQLERKWKAQYSLRRTGHPTGYVDKEVESGIHVHARKWSRAMRTKPTRLQEADNQESQPLSPTMQASQVESWTETQHSHLKVVLWKADTSWSITRDGVSAFLEFIRALIGYILMLAVMTYNVGLLLAVTGSVLFGELIFGRFTRSSMVLAEDECHS